MNVRYCQCLAKLTYHCFQFAEPGPFYEILVEHIQRILEEREHYLQDSDWILNEAMDIRQLQKGGTFMNVLTRKYDDVIIPIFSEIIAFMDHNCNLSLLQIKDCTTSLCQLWLKTFSSDPAKQALHYNDMVSTPMIPMTGEEFSCNFPFSWLYKELIDANWDIALSTGGISLFLSFLSTLDACILCCTIKHQGAYWYA